MEMCWFFEGVRLITPICGNGNVNFTDGTRYHPPLYCEQEAKELAERISQPIPQDCNIDQFRLRIGGTGLPGTDPTRQCVFTIVKFTDADGELDTTMEVTVVADDVTVHAAPLGNVSFSQGDRIAIKCVTSNLASGGFEFFYSFLIESTDAMIFSSAGGELGFSITETGDHALAIQGQDTHEQSQNFARIEMIMPQDGTFKNLFVRLSDAVGGTEKSFDFIVYVNNAASSLNVFLESGESEGSNTTDTVDVVKGDLVYMFVNFTGSITIGSRKHQRFSTSFVPSIAGTFPYMGVDRSTSLISDVQEIHGAQTFENNATDGIDECLCPPITVKSSIVKIETAPGASGTFQFAIQKNDVNTTNLVTFSGSDTQKESDEDVVFLCGDLIRWRLDETGSPSGPNIYQYSLVCKYDGDKDCPNPFRPNSFISHPPSGGNTLNLC